MPKRTRKKKRSTGLKTCENAWKMRYSDRQSALAGAESVLSSSDEQQEIAAASVICALLKFWEGDPASESHISRALEELELLQESCWQVRALWVRASMDDQLGRYDHGMECCIQAVEIADRNAWTADAADARNAMAQLNMRTERYEEAAQGMEKVLEARQALGDAPGTGSALNMLARISVLRKSFDKAEKYYQSARRHREQHDDRRGLCWTMLGLATLYAEWGQPRKAKDFFNIGLEINEAFQDKVFEMLCKLGLSRLLVEDGEAEQGIRLLDHCLSVADQLQAKPLQANVLEVMHTAYLKAGRQDEAYQWLLKYLKTREEVLNTGTLNRISALENAHKIESARQEAEIHRLKNVALRAALEQIENQRLQLEERNRNITDSIKYAALLQQSIMPDPGSLKQMLPDSFLIFEPRDIVSGDFYYFARQDGFFHVAIADCTGHGVPGAMVSMVAANALSKCVEFNTIAAPGEILNAVRELITGSFRFSEKQVRDGMDIALCRIPVVRSETIDISFAGANNPLWVIMPIVDIPEGDYKIMRDENEEWALVEVPSDRQTVGYSDDARPFTSRILKVPRRTCLYMFSDGLADQFGGTKGKKLKSKSLKKLLMSLHEMPMEQQKEEILHIFRTWKEGYEQIDDICLAGIRL